MAFGFGSSSCFFDICFLRPWQMYWSSWEWFLWEIIFSNLYDLSTKEYYIYNFWRRFQSFFFFFLDEFPHRLPKMNFVVLKFFPVQTFFPVLLFLDWAVFLYWLEWSPAFETRQVLPVKLNSILIQAIRSHRYTCHCPALLIELPSEITYCYSKVNCIVSLGLTASWQLASTREFCFCCGIKPDDPKVHNAPVFISRNLIVKNLVLKLLTLGEKVSRKLFFSSQFRYLS